MMLVLGFGINLHLSVYQKLGYQIEYVREGFEKDSKMFTHRPWLIVL
jgi:hypothetical protein